MNSEPTEKTKKPRESKPTPSVIERLDGLDKWRTDVGEELRTLKQNLAEFLFQAVAIVVGLFAIFITIVLSSTIQWNFNNENKYMLLLGLLIILVIIISIWLFLWYKLHFKK